MRMLHAVLEEDLASFVERQRRWGLEEPDLPLPEVHAPEDLDAVARLLEPLTRGTVERRGEHVVFASPLDERGAGREYLVVLVDLTPGFPGERLGLHPLSWNDVLGPRRARAWAPEGEGLPPRYSHHPGLSSGPYWQTGHVVCRLEDGVEPGCSRVVWQAVGRDSQHALELAWQHREGEPLDDPIAVWDADDHPGFRNTGMNYGYPYPIAPRW